MNNPKITVIIPVYNGANYISESIESAKAQTYKNLEILIINDGSTDNGETEIIARQYLDDERVKYYNKDNGGVSSALNFGILRASGTYISWLSHDDLYDKKKIELQLEYINKNLLNENSILVAGVEIINGEGNKLYDLNVSASFIGSQQEILLKMLKKSSINGCALLIPKIIFKKYGLFNEQLLFTQDTDYWMNLILEDIKFVYYPKQLVKYRIHENQTTNKIPEVGMKERRELFLKIYENTLKVSFFSSSQKMEFLKIMAYKGYAKDALALGLTDFQVKNSKTKLLFKVILGNLSNKIYKILSPYKHQLKKYKKRGEENV